MISQLDSQRIEFVGSKSALRRLLHVGPTSAPTETEMNTLTEHCPCKGYTTSERTEHPLSRDQENQDSRAS